MVTAPEILPRALQRPRSLLLIMVVLGAMMAPTASVGARSIAANGRPELTRPRVMQAAAALAAAPAPRGLYSSYSSAPIQRVALATASTSPLQREVFGFVNAGNLTNSSVGWTTWNLSLLSTVAFFGLQVNSGDGNLITSDTGWAVDLPRGDRLRAAEPAVLRGGNALQLAGDPVAGRRLQREQRGVPFGSDVDQPLRAALHGTDRAALNRDRSR